MLGVWIVHPFYIAQGRSRGKLRGWAKDAF
jgi:hypothetical protein